MTDFILVLVNSPVRIVLTEDSDKSFGTSRLGTWESLSKSCSPHHVCEAYTAVRRVTSVHCKKIEPWPLCVPDTFNFARSTDRHRNSKLESKDKSPVSHPNSESSNRFAREQWRSQSTRRLTKGRKNSRSTFGTNMMPCCLLPLPLSLSRSQLFSKTQQKVGRHTT
eukprot:m.199707 g.199707  ORF g.199707 m.199707 type:complete len:166 (+) comp15324_c0_seq1:3102-3599(+)